MEERSPHFVVTTHLDEEGGDIVMCQIQQQFRVPGKTINVIRCLQSRVSYDPRWILDGALSSKTQSETRVLSSAHNVPGGAKPSYQESLRKSEELYRTDVNAKARRPEIL